MPDSPLFVVIVIGDENSFSAIPRAIGPFEDFDVAQAFSLTLIERYRAEGGDVPTASVVRVESDLPGVVVGEM
jgi:hypothetical protein